MNVERRSAGVCIAIKAVHSPSIQCFLGIIQSARLCSEMNCYASYGVLAYSCLCNSYIWSVISVSCSRDQRFFIRNICLSISMSALEFACRIHIVGVCRPGRVVSCLCCYQSIEHIYPTEPVAALHKIIVCPEPSFISSHRLSRWLRLRIRHRGDQLLHDLAARLAANLLDLLHLNIRVLLRVLLGLLVA
jgi:hypothetical protein